MKQKGFRILQTCWQNRYRTRTLFFSRNQQLSNLTTADDSLNAVTYNFTPSTLRSNFITSGTLFFWTCCYLFTLIIEKKITETEVELCLLLKRKSLFAIVHLYHLKVGTRESERMCTYHDKSSFHPSPPICTECNPMITHIPPFLLLCVSFHLFPQIVRSSWHIFSPISTHLQPFPPRTSDISYW